MELQILVLHLRIRDVLSLRPCLAGRTGWLLMFQRLWRKGFPALAAFPSPEQSSAHGMQNTKVFLAPETKGVTVLLCWPLSLSLSATGGTERNIKTKQCKAPERSGICHLTPFMWKAIAKHPVDNLLFLASTSCC